MGIEIPLKVYLKEIKMIFLKSIRYDFGQLFWNTYKNFFEYFKIHIPEY